MRSLSFQAARSFSRSFSSTGAHTIGLRDLIRRSNTAHVIEGTAEFGVWRDNLLRDSERNHYLSAACFASGMRTMRSGAAFWSGVSYYYSAFLAAKALMGMFGCWIDSPKLWVEVTSTRQGSIRLDRRLTKYPNSTATGSHQVFWDAFYQFSSSLTSYATPEQGIAILPVQNDPYWLIDTRNRINYRSNEAFDLLNEFQASFDSTRLPSSIPGDLSTLFRTSKAFLSFVGDIRANLSLATDVFGHREDLRSAFARGVMPPLSQEVLDFVDHEMRAIAS